MRVEGTLRNAETVQASRVRFVSAELHRRTDAFDVRGEILTWVTTDDKTFEAVDAAARRYSSWPKATSVDLSDAGARTSRGCVYPDRGRKICIGGANSSPFPVRGKCPTTPSTVPGAPK